MLVDKNLHAISYDIGMLGYSSAMLRYLAGARSPGLVPVLNYAPLLMVPHDLNKLHATIGNREITPLTQTLQTLKLVTRISWAVSPLLAYALGLQKGPMPPRTPDCLFSIMQGAYILTSLHGLWDAPLVDAWPIFVALTAIRELPLYAPGFFFATQALATATYLASCLITWEPQ